MFFFLKLKKAIWNNAYHTSPYKPWKSNPNSPYNVFQAFLPKFYIFILQSWKEYLSWIIVLYKFSFLRMAIYAKWKNRVLRKPVFAVC